jgi:predicted RNase H-like nuclease
MLVAGADGCPKGWVIVTAEVIPGALALRSVTVAPSFVSLILATRACEAVAVDIPMGLTDSIPRAADIAARRLLGRPRSSSVFPPPLRAIISCIDYRIACETSVLAGGKRLSKETFNILPKIREADAALTLELQHRIFESHPEVCFAMLNGGRAMACNKKTPAGRAEREQLLDSLYGECFAVQRPPAGAARDDFYDAAVLAWTASRVAKGVEARLPAEPEIDARGLRMEIVY